MFAYGCFAGYVWGTLFPVVGVVCVLRVRVVTRWMVAVASLVGAPWRVPWAVLDCNCGEAGAFGTGSWVGVAFVAVAAVGFRC